MKVFESSISHIEMAILDLSMPGRDGLGVMEDLWKRRPELPILLCSGYAEQELRGGLAQLKAVDFIQKPYDLRELKEKLQRLLPSNS